MDTRTHKDDPTRLTTEAVDRAIEAYRNVVSTRLQGMDRATELLAEALLKIEAGTDTKLDHMVDDRRRGFKAEREFVLEKIENVRAVSQERFDAVATQFSERDTRTDQAASESRVSLDAALAAAKEAVSEQNKANALAIGKSEDATKERLDSVTALMTSGLASLDDKIGDLKGRLDRGEGRGTGAAEQKTETRLNNAAVYAVIGLIFAVAGTVVGVVISLVAG